MIREAATLLDIHQLSGTQSRQSLQSTLNRELSLLRAGDLFPIERFFEECGPLDNTSRDGFLELYSFLKRELNSHDILVYWTGKPLHQPTPLYALRDEDEEGIYDELIADLLALVLETPLEEEVGLAALDAVLEECVPTSITLGALDLTSVHSSLLQEANATEELIQEWFSAIEAAEDTLEVGIILPDYGAPAMMAADGFDEDVNDEVVNLILACMEHTELENIIDPDKLRGYLGGELQSMWDGESYDLQELWEVLKGAPGVNRPMLMEVFLRIEKDNLQQDHPLRLPPDIVAMSPDQKAEFFDRLEAVRARAEAAMAEELEPLPIPAAPVVQEPIPASAPVQASPAPPTPQPPTPQPLAPQPQAVVKPLPDPRSLQANRQRTESGRLGGRTQSGRIQTARKLQSVQAKPEREGSFPKWLFALLFLSILCAGIGYYVYLYKPAPAFEGTQVNNKILNKLPYVQDMRGKPGLLMLIVKPTFFKMKEEVKEVELMRIIQQAKTLQVKKIYFFNENGNYISKVEF